MSEMQISQILHQMRTLTAVAQQEAQPQVAGVPGGGGFADMLRQSLEKVDGAQKAANGLATAFEIGDPAVDLAQVMIAQQKASVTFEAAVQVRNKLLEAYREVMSMPV